MKKIKIELTEQEVNYLQNIVYFTDLCSKQIFGLYLLNDRYKEVFDSISEKLKNKMV